MGITDGLLRISVGLEHVDDVDRRPRRRDRLTPADVPELIEVETYRRQAEAVVGRTIADAPVLDPFGLRHDDPDAVREPSCAASTVTGDRPASASCSLLDTDGPTSACGSG